MDNQQLLDNVKAYIIDAINTSLSSRDEKINYLRNTFTYEYGHSLRNVALTRALSDYYSTLPPCINLAYTNLGIYHHAKKWGLLPENPTIEEEEKVLGHWWNLLAKHTVILFGEVA